MLADEEERPIGYLQKPSKHSNSAEKKKKEARGFLEVGEEGPETTVFIVLILYSIAT